MSIMDLLQGRYGGGDLRSLMAGIPATAIQPNQNPGWTPTAMGGALPTVEPFQVPNNWRPTQQPYQQFQPPPFAMPADPFGGKQMQSDPFGGKNQGPMNMQNWGGPAGGGGGGVVREGQIPSY